MNLSLNYMADEKTLKEISKNTLLKAFDKEIAVTKDLETKSELIFLRARVEIVLKD